MNAQTQSFTADPAANAGWIEHDGTGCPLPYGTRVHVRLSNGATDTKATFAGFWSAHGKDRWKRHHDWHIAAYRLAPMSVSARHDIIAARRAAEEPLAMHMVQIPGGLS